MTEHFDPEAETVSDEWVGVYISCSWGYDQTQRNYAQIVDVSGTGKTVLCRRVGQDVVDRPDKTYENVVPSSEQVGPEFRLHVRCRSSADEPYFKGSYPYIWSEIAEHENDPKGYDGDPSTRMGMFMVCDSNPEPDYQTAPNAGH
jgi:hypothetical protein